MSEPLDRPHWIQSAEWKKFQRELWWGKFWRVAKTTGWVLVLFGLAIGMMLFLSSRI